MGFRSSFTTEHYAIEWPEWFVAKYKEFVFFDSGYLASKGEWKAYFTLPDLHEDIRKAINWRKLTVSNFVLVWLHECGGITRVQIEAKRIQISEPLVWSELQCIGHSYCYGCSDA